MASRRSLHKVALLAGALAINGVAHAQTYPSPAVSSLHFVPGTGVASPSDGDCWITVNGLFCRINGATIGPYSSGAVTGIVPVANGGTGVGSAGGTALDNISGFASTGVLQRTGAGAYSLLTSASLDLFLPAKCANILSYTTNATGLVSGTVDAASAFNAAVAASNPNAICVYMPAGNYTFSATIGVNGGSSSTASITVKGDGADSTRLAFTGAAKSGLFVGLNKAQQSFHIRDLSILAGFADTGVTSAGINIQQSGTVPLPNPGQNDISNLTVRGSDGYNATNYFGYGIYSDGASNINFVGVNVVGSASGAAYTNHTTPSSGLYLLSSNSNIVPVQFNVVGSQFNYNNYGIKIGNYVQGLSVNTTNFVGNSYGIYLPSGNTANDQLSVVGSQFNSSSGDIYLASPIDGVAITASDFYLASGGAAAIEMGGYQYAITGNAFIQFPGTAGNGVIIDAYSLDRGTITSNTFNGFLTGVVLNANSSRATVMGNTFNQTTQNIYNAGTNNDVRDPTLLTVTGTLGLGTGGASSLNLGDSNAGVIGLASGTGSSSASGSVTLTFQTSANSQYVCTMSGNDSSAMWSSSAVFKVATISATQLNLSWYNGGTALTPSATYYINYQCQPR